MPTFDFTAPDGTTHSIEGPEGATREQAFHVLQLKLGGGSQPPAPAPAAPQESLAADVGKSAGGGMEAGFNDLIALPHGVSRLAHAIAPQSLIDKVKAIPGAQTLYNSLPDIDQVNAAAAAAHQPGRAPPSIGPSALIPDAYKDPTYQPQTAPGRYAHALTENAVPGLVTGMSPLAVGAGAIGGQLTEDVTGSKTAGSVANLASSIAAPLALARYGKGYQAMQALKDAGTVKAGAQSVYNGPELSSALVGQQGLKDLALNTDQTLARRQFDPDAIGEVRKIVDRWHGTDQPQSIADLQNSRARLNELSTGAPTTQTAAAGVVKGHLDDYLNNLQPQHVVSGDPQRAAQLLKDANADYRYANSSSKISNIIQKAQDTAGTQNSGMNYGNLQRKGLLPLLDNDAAKLKQMGFGTADDIDAVRTATQGDFGTNLSRRASNMLGGGGGIAATAVSALAGKLLSPTLGGLAGAEEGGRNGGWLGALTGAAAGAATGHTLRSIANARTMRSVKAIQDAILAKAPANAGIVASNNAARAANAASYSSAVGRNGIPAVLLQAIAMHKYGIH